MGLKMEREVVSDYLDMMAFKVRAPPKAQVPVIKVKTLSMWVCCDPESYPPGLCDTQKDTPEVVCV